MKKANRIAVTLLHLSFLTLNAQNDTCSEASMPSTCTFLTEPDTSFGQNGIRCTATDGQGTQGAQAGVIYIWYADALGTVSGNLATCDMYFDKPGVYNIRMCAVNIATSCTCCYAKNVVVSNLSVQNPKEVFSLFPNPAKNAVSVYADGINKTIIYVIFDASGRMLRQGNTQSGLPIDMSQFQNGMYTLLIETNNKRQKLPLLILRQ